MKNRSPLYKFIFIALSILAVIYGLALLYILFLGRHGVWGDAPFSQYIRYNTNFIPFRTISEYFLSSSDAGRNIELTNLIGNLILFAPFSFFMWFFKKPAAGKYAIILFIVTLVVEFLQLVFRVGSCDIDDVILNFAGGFLAYLLFSRLSR